MRSLVPLQPCAATATATATATVVLARLAARARERAPVGLQIAAALAAGASCSAAAARQGPAACSSAASAVAAAVASAAAGKKAYLVQPTMSDPFVPAQLGQVLLLAAAMPLSQQLDAAVKRFTAAQNAGGVTGVTVDENGKGITPFSLIDWETLRESAAFNCAKSLTNKTLHKAAQIALWQYLDGDEGQQMIAKLIKDVAASAERKALRAADSGGGNLTAASSIGYTYVRAAVLTWTVFHIVEFSWGFSGLPQGRAFRENLKEAVRMPLVLVGGACGAMVGTAAWPGLGTAMGVMAGEMLPGLMCPAVCEIPDGEKR